MKLSPFARPPPKFYISVFIYHNLLFLLLRHACWGSVLTETKINTDQTDPDVTMLVGQGLIRAPSSSSVSTFLPGSPLVAKSLVQTSTQAALLQRSDDYVHAYSVMSTISHVCDHDG